MLERLVMPFVDFKSKYAACLANVTACEYANGGTCIRITNAQTGEPMLTATSWIPGIPDGHVAVKDYSENEGVLEELIRLKIVSSPVSCLSGFPICTLLV